MTDHSTQATDASLLAELVAADQRYDAAIAAMKEHYRIIATYGMLPVHLEDARALQMELVRAEEVRRQALEACTGDSQ